MISSLSVETAVGAIQPGETIVLPPGCGEALAFERELGRQSERLVGSHVYSGLLLSDYPFLAPEASYRYGTWHVMAPVRKRVNDGLVDIFPVRGSQVHKLFRPGGLAVDNLVLHVTPPDRNGYCSLGPSASYPLALVRMASRVIAQVNPRVPRTLGRNLVHTSEIDLFTEVDDELVQYRAAQPDAVSEKIGEYIAELIPDGAMLQIGIGAIPEAVLSSLAQSEKRNLRVYGMGTDGFIELVENGVVATDLTQGPAMISTELMGSRALFDFAEVNPLIEMHPSEQVLDPARFGAFDKAISINSAIQIDLLGQVNAEMVKGQQISGVGGSFDFLQGAWTSAGGRSILAMPSANIEKNYSRIVCRLESGTPVSVPRHYVQTVVTEFGVAHLDTHSVRDRAEALIDIAHPAFREELSSDLGGL